MRGILVGLIVLTYLSGCTAFGDDYQKTSIENVTNNRSAFFGEEIRIEGFLVVSYTGRGKDVIFLKDPKGNVMNLMLPGTRDETKGWNMGQRYLRSGEYYRMGGRYVKVVKGAYDSYSLNVTKVY